MPKSYQLWVATETVKVKKMQTSKSKNCRWFVDTHGHMSQVKLSLMGILNKNLSEPQHPSISQVENPGCFSSLMCWAELPL